MAEHTKGPWKAETFGAPRVLATDEKGSFPVCDIRGWGHLTGQGSGGLGLKPELAADIQDANARLIAAAPDLLAALERAQKIIDREFPNGQAAIDIRAALHLAKRGAAATTKESV